MTQLQKAIKEVSEDPMVPATVVAALKILARAIDEIQWAQEAVMVD